jgi:DNA polymerase III subunit alpha
MTSKTLSSNLLYCKMKQTIIVFDTETTGLPPRPSRFKKYHNPKTEYMFYDSSRVVELAYIVYMYDDVTHTHTVVHSHASLVSPNDEFVIMNEAIHGITQEMAVNYGRPIKNVLCDFLEALSNVDIIVAHNIEFDMNIILAEFYRAKLDPIKLLPIQQVCTIRLAMDVLKLDKYPKLIDLYNKLHPRLDSCSQTHRALDDTEKCAESYFALRKYKL